MNCTVTQHPAGGGNDSATQLSAVARDKAGQARRPVPLACCACIL